MSTAKVSAKIHVYSCICVHVAIILYTFILPERLVCDHELTYIHNNYVFYLSMF